jgi:hypothetical protein
LVSGSTKKLTAGFETKLEKTIVTGFEVKLENRRSRF